MAFLLFVVLSFLIVDFYSDAATAAGDVGVVLAACIQLTGMLQWGMRQSAELENLMTSVERMLEYGRLDSEAPLDQKGDPDQKEWPSEGRIKFTDVTLKYDNADDEDGKERLALKGVTFETKSAEKVRAVTVQVSVHVNFACLYLF